ncbi:tail protein [Bacillus phage vB_BmeM-Goe8]|uniref:Putative pectate lyase protein n=1 Tax=Bacillus phage vB_BmeM-Goe8 TaxID=2593638 RepID=A0A516KMQ3_9CAUD|nr:tail protein [Bacillus phage vB_BmeM-Goe8]QDP42878.1 putative pectate lyase protein [Bacillus phage vB_BmeM-Goe8]
MVVSKNFGSVSVQEFGAKGDGTTDDTQAFIKTVNYVRDLIISTNFKKAPTVVIPGGIYLLSSKVTISPFVHLETEGFVLINSTLTSGTLFHFTPQAGDPTFLSLMAKQQYMRSPLINASRGGLLIHSNVTRATNTATALELGSTTDMGASLPLSRYTVTDVAIEGFDVAMQMNTYNHYIGTFFNLHLEGNNTLVKFGKTIGNVVNSGENFNFHGGTFAAAKIAFDWFVDGMDCNFYGCSFDFVDTVFNLQRGWKRIFVSGGHIEGIKGGAATEGIVVAQELGTPGAIAQVILQSPIVYCNNPILFRGSFQLTCDNVRWERVTQDFANMYVCDDNVIVSEKQRIVQGMDFALSSRLNVLQNSKFQKSDTTAGDAVAPFTDYTVTSSGFTAPVVTTSIPADTRFTKALKSTATAATGTWMQFVTDAYTVKPGEKLQVAANIYMTAASFRNIEFKFAFYDKSGTNISSTNNYGNKTGAAASKWQTIFGAIATVPAGADTVKVYCTVSQLITDEVFYLSELFLGRS